METKERNASFFRFEDLRIYDKAVDYSSWVSKTLNKKVLATSNNTLKDGFVKIEDNESGSSGGLIAALTIYNNLVKEDITKGLTIVGTGTIELDGTVGSIGGVEKKLKSAENAKADIFLVPNGENYKEAIKLKKEKNYKIKVVGVSTFDEALKALKE